MRAAVSNIAWRSDERFEAYALLRAAGITGLEIAPGLYFFDAQDPFLPPVAACQRARREIAAQGLSLVSMQSLLFGTAGSELFGDAKAQVAFNRAMERAINLANQLEIPNLVFGSPKQRIIPDSMDYAAAQAIATETFLRLGDRAKQAGTQISLEPNPVIYETNFLTTLRETIDFVQHVNHPAIRLTLDFGALHATGEIADLADILSGTGNIIGHAHLSAPWLVAPSETGRDIHSYRGILDQAGYRGPFSLEMKRQDAGLESLSTAVASLAAGSVL